MVFGKFRKSEFSMPSIEMEFYSTCYCDLLMTMTMITMVMMMNEPILNVSFKFLIRYVSCDCAYREQKRQNENINCYLSFMNLHSAIIHVLNNNNDSALIHLQQNRNCSNNYQNAAQHFSSHFIGIRKDDSNKIGEHKYSRK